MIDVRQELNENTVYIKTVDINGTIYYTAHTNMGFPITTFDDREVAFATVRQHDLTPMSLH